MVFLGLAIAFILGVILSSRIVAVIHDAETSIHDRLRKLEGKLTAIEEALKGKL